MNAKQARYNTNNFDNKYYDISSYIKDIDSEINNISLRGGNDFKYKATDKGLNSNEIERVIKYYQSQRFFAERGGMSNSGCIIFCW